MSCMLSGAVHSKVLLEKLLHCTTTCSCISCMVDSTNMQLNWTLGGRVGQIILILTPILNTQESDSDSFLKPLAPCSADSATLLSNTLPIF